MKQCVIALTVHIRLLAQKLHVTEQLSVYEHED